MVFYHFSWSGAISLRSSQYQKPGYVEKYSFLPEKRMNLLEEMERRMKGYMEMRKEFAECKEAMEKHEQMKTGCYKSPDRFR